MINFPVFQRFEVSNYGLYPGTPKRPGLQIDFKPGLTLILGANGLGKTTLITMLYRTLAGGWELSRTTLDAVELGGASLDWFRMASEDRALFADRVQDLAADAHVTLTLMVGGKNIKIRRRLANLGLTSLQIDDEEPIVDEEKYMALMPELCGVPTFGDWLLLLRHLVFYFEDRRSLVWDVSAQRQIFRMIFLPPSEAETWYTREREILKLDSNVRNLTSALNRVRKRVAADEKAHGNVASLHSQINSLTALQEKDEADRAEILAEFDSLDRVRHKYRRELLDAELNVDASARKQEVEKLSMLQRHFPTGKETAQYLYSLLVAQGRCAVCDSEAPETAKALSDRITNMCCVVCGSNLEPDVKRGNITSLEKARVDRLRQEYEQNKKRVQVLERSLEKASSNYSSVLRRLTELKTRIDDRAANIEKIVNALPSGDAKQAKARQELAVLSSKVGEDKATLAVHAESFVRQIAAANEKILAHSGDVKASFAEFADGFLFEEAILKWSPLPTSVGQLGLAKVTFPAFQLDMSGADFTSPTRRSGPNAVSESQREFIDLAFRMALVHVAGGGAGGSLVLDAPESSLDAVFVKRAAEVLCRFSHVDAPNRLVVASNLVDGELLPALIKGGIKPGEQGDRLVNLMESAVPTAALRENASDYGAELAKILKNGGLTR